MNPEPTSPEFCPAFRDALQACLDRATDSLPAECEAHRAACSSCRQDYVAAMLVRAFSRSPVQAPAEMTDRLVVAVLADSAKIQLRRRLTRAASIVPAVAACLLLAVALINRFAGSPNPQPAAARNDEIAKDQTPARISVDDNFANAGDALAALARRSASETFEPTRKLIPENPALNFPNALPNATEPAAQSLAEIRQGASSGFEPLGRTARRAFDLFLRDIPVQAQNKPGS